jgi:hypothetical protein
VHGQGPYQPHNDNPVISDSNLLHPLVAMGCSFRLQVHNSAHIQPSYSPALISEFIFTFLQIKSLCVFKLISKKKIGGGVFPAQHNKNLFILFYYDNVFWSTEPHQAISTELKTGYNTVQIIFI